MQNEQAPENKESPIRSVDIERLTELHGKATSTSQGAEAQGFGIFQFGLLVRQEWPQITSYITSLREEVERLKQRCDGAEMAFAHEQTCREQAEGRSKRLEDMLIEAGLQLEYLDDKCPTGTTPTVLARIESALSETSTLGVDQHGK